MNYRLGVLGDRDVAGVSGAAVDSNLPLRHQVAALQWVRDNIPPFGGAPAGKRPLDKSMYHLIERSENVVTMMKTDTGNRLAKDKMDRLRVFQAWWLDEMKLAS